MKKFEIIVANWVGFGPIIKNLWEKAGNTPIFKGIEEFNDENGVHLIFNVDNDIELDGLRFINENTLEKI